MAISDAENRPAVPITELQLAEVDLARQIAGQAIAHANEVISPAAFANAKAAADNYLNAALTKYNAAT